MAGTILIRFLHRVRRRISGRDGYFSFSDFLVEDRIIEHRAFIWMALPPLAGGVAVSLWPGVDALIAAGAGLAAAFLGVWPVFQFPYHVLDDYLQPYWGKLRYLYILFIGSSGALAYLGYVTRTKLAPIAAGLMRTNAWRDFLDNLAANAMYDVLKCAVVALLVAGGVYVNRKRNEIGTAAAAARAEDWNAEMGNVSATRDETRAQ